MHAYLKTYFYENYTVKIPFHAEFRSVKMFAISFTVQNIELFFNCASPQCEAFFIMSKTLLFSVFKMLENVF